MVIAGHTQSVCKDRMRTEVAYAAMGVISARRGRLGSGASREVTRNPTSCLHGERGMHAPCVGRSREHAVPVPGRCPTDRARAGQRTLTVGRVVCSPRS